MNLKQIAVIYNWKCEIALVLINFKMLISGFLILPPSHCCFILNLNCTNTRNSYLYIEDKNKVLFHFPPFQDILEDILQICSHESK